MPIALGTSLAAFGASTGNAISADWTPSANDVVLLWISMRTTTIQVTVAGNNLTWTERLDVTEIGDAQSRGFMFSGAGAAPTTGAITVGAGANIKPIGCIAQQFTGVDETTADGIEASFADSGDDPDSANMKTSLTTLTNNAWGVAGGQSRNAAFTVPAGEISITINNIFGTGGDTQRVHMWYEEVASAGSITVGADADLTSPPAPTDWIECLVALKPDAGAAAFKVFKNLMGVGI